MIEARQFLDPAKNLGYATYCGVPCSYLKPFINYVISDGAYHYIPSTNEGDAIASAAGYWLAGKRAIAMMQNSGLGNAVNPITSLCHTCRIPQLFIVTWRGSPDHADEPQHELMGRITSTLLDDMSVAWEYFPQEDGEVAPSLGRVEDHFSKSPYPFAYIMRKGSVDAYPIQESSSPPLKDSIHEVEDSTPISSRKQVLEFIIENTDPKNTAIIATTGYTGRELESLSDRDNQFYMVGSMGCASSIGLGLALARPDLKVIVIDGDGALLMRMGSLATIGQQSPSNLFHLLLDNGLHESTGGQRTVSGNVVFSKVARDCGYQHSLNASQLKSLGSFLNQSQMGGAKFMHMPILPGTAKDLSRPKLPPHEVARRFRSHFEEAS